MTVRKRLFTIIRIVIRIILDFRKENILIKKYGYSRAQDLIGKRHEKQATRLYNAAIEMKGALIKLCQFLSTRVDMLPEPYIRILKSLQDNVPASDFADMEIVLRSEYEDYTSVFKEIDRKPLASASLAQVHKAVLHTGETIVLKILKPDIEGIIDIDFAILFKIFSIFSHFKFFKRMHEINKILNDFVQVTGDELNFIREANIAQLFRDRFSDKSNIYIPCVYTDFSSRRVLAMEYIHGNKISDREKWEKRNNDPGKIARIIINFYADQLFDFGFIHFDPHPGNILVMDNDYIAVIDFGMSGTISNEMKEGFIDFMDAFYRKDSIGAIEAADHLGFFSANFNKYSLKPLFEFFFKEVYSIIDSMNIDRQSIHETYRKIDFKKIQKDFLELLYTQPFVIPTNWVYIGKTIGSLVGLISSLDPGVNILTEMRAHIDKYSKNNFSFILKKMYRTASANLSRLVRLPERVNNFLDEIESGVVDVKVDYAKLIWKLDEFKLFIVRIVSLLIFSSCIIVYIIFYNMDFSGDMFTIPLIGIFISVIVPLLYKKRILRENRRW